MKKCSRCKNMLPLDNFYNSKSKGDGKQTYCKSCKKSSYKKWYEDNKEHHLEMGKNLGEKQPRQG